MSTTALSRAHAACYAPADWRPAVAAVPRSPFSARPLWSAEPTDPDPAMATLLTVLDSAGIRPGMRVLHVGCASGYATALICHRTGDADLVTATSADPAEAAAARWRLAQAGYPARVVIARPDQGHARCGPYDRIVCTDPIGPPPAAWREQLAPGGRVALPPRM
ncbi:protein-L-isoaspartate O-methyltransferase family protein [Nocardiopsis baichengensis]|uniref:protein-L-isoaspartate O-methyltransferase family protein n=1 Tax=Nocardiopsis baichengensis TaxID=280240 RepID=UPI00034DFA2C|nr:hypothetical protein [Nocardiopsis baichengensis]